MYQDLKPAFVDILRWEGGMTISPAEPGGASNWGISMVSFTDWRHKHKLSPPTIDDLQSLTQDQAITIYEENWVGKISFDLLPVGVDLRMLDICINLGVTGGINLLQRVLDIRETGKMDGYTWLAMRSFIIVPDRLVTLINDLSIAWLALKFTQVDWHKYEAGWKNRNNDITQKCLDMIKSMK
jgi:lysozyme family protein